MDEGRRYKSKKQKPCDACRRRKICCVREPGYDTCSLCRTKSEKCQFNSLPNIRKGRDSRYSQSTTVLSESSNLAPKPSFTTTARPRQQRLKSLKPDILPPPRPTKEWISWFVGSSGDQDPFLLRHCSFNDLNYYKRPDWACLRVNGDGEGATHFTLVPDSHLDARPRYYPKQNLEDVVIEDIDQLRRTFFETVHTAYPLLDPAQFEKDASPGELLLAVIYEIASPYCLQRTHPNDMGILDWIFQAMPCDIRQPRLETIEAALLFAQRQARYHRAPFTPGLWEDIGSLVGMSHDVGLNVDPSNWVLTPEDRNRRIRLWWAVYIQDKWCALGLGRPSYINDEHFNVPLPIVNNFAHYNIKDLPTPDVGILQFIGMAALTTILSDILSTFYSLRATERLKTYSSELLHLLLEQFRQRLDLFHDQHLTPLYNVEGFLDPTGTIFLAYYTVQLTLYRAILRHLEPDDFQYHLMRDSSRVVLSLITSLLQDMTVRRLRAFWWSQMSNINFAIAGGFMMSLLLTSVADSEVEYWTEQIKLYHDLLQSQSVSFHPTRLAASRMSLLIEVSQNGELGTDRFSGSEAKHAFCGDFRVEFGEGEQQQ